MIMHRISCWELTDIVCYHKLLAILRTRIYEVEYSTGLSGVREGVGTTSTEIVSAQWGVLAE